MSVKKLLGLESFPICDSEIMQKIKDAQRQQLTEVEFIFNQKKVKIKIPQLAPEAMMRGYSYYHDAK
ncbi:MAG: hypothetical protein KKH52_04200 [Nanoarchaeota archaeon]|nr:hypothetical protein [Nanoarchaeota archaeon]MBU1622965.1 hypothetical protein [Nanoarchaeota archaeon]MBU1974572.1 hypothetical protein [Nanoarchaeota archaeon]